MAKPPTLELEYTSPSGEKIRFTMNHELHTSFSRLAEFVKNVSCELQDILAARQANEIADSKIGEGGD